MFVNIKAFLFDAGIHTETVQFLDAKEQDKTANCCPKVDDEDAEALSSEEAPTITIESTVRSGEQACHQCAEDAADTMHG